MSVREWHLLSADSIGADACLWWKPNSQGYTTNLDAAGLYTEDDALKMERSSGQSSIAVHRFHAREASVPTVCGGHLRETGALEVFDLRRAVEEAWSGGLTDQLEAADDLGWPDSIAELVSRWYQDESTLYLAEWRLVGSTVSATDPGSDDVEWPTVEVSLEVMAAEIDDAVVARAKIGRVKLSEVGADRAAASANLIEAARVRGPIERGET